MEDKLTSWVVAGLVVVAVLAGVGMMNKPEQTRPLSYDKGEYGGKPDTALDEATVESLRQRTSNFGNSGL